MTKTNPDITSGLTWLEKLLNLYKKMACSVFWKAYWF